MSNWKYKIEIDARGRNARDVATELKQRLELLPASFRALSHNMTSLNEMVWWLDDVNDDESANDVLYDLYNWGDRHRLYLYLNV